MFHSGETNVNIPQPVRIVKTSLRGRPRKIVDLDYLHEAISNTCQIKFTKLAGVLGIHRNTLHLHMKCHSIERKYSQLSNADLDDLITEFKKWRPESGICYIVGFLRWHGICIQHRRIVQSLHQINSLGQVLHNRQVKHRRQYRVKRPNSLWHLNGHHKLSKWGIVIHGVIDGFCRTVCAYYVYLLVVNCLTGDRFTCK
jgi:hypothetical protein